MERLACVDVPELPLQLLVRRHPELARHPTVVVDRDEPQGRILHADDRARRCRIRPGQRYAEALALCATLRADVVEPAEVAAAVDEIRAVLGRFSPVVEPSATEVGVFWLDASGFRRLFPSLRGWAQDLERALGEIGLRAAVVVGFDRFATAALARAGGRVQVLRTAAEERAASDRVPLDRLGLQDRLHRALDRLGVRDVGGLRALPPGGLLERFGAEGQRLQAAAAGTDREPLTHDAPEEPVVERFAAEPDDPALDLESLLLLIGQRLARLRETLVRRGSVLAALHVRLLLDRGGVREERLAPAAPTLDLDQVVRLVRLRLESVVLESAPAGFELCAETAPLTREQLQLFVESPRRDLRAGERALARLRARFGDAAVRRAVLREGHLPEARFAWEPLQGLPVARPHSDAPPQLVRTLLARPRVLPGVARGPDGWFVDGVAAGAVRTWSGPYVVSGGWWATEQRRDYHFAETARGDLLWVFHDHGRRRWYLHGVIA